jgi:hypothetical protein
MSKSIRASFSLRTVVNRVKLAGDRGFSLVAHGEPVTSQAECCPCKRLTWSPCSWRVRCIFSRSIRGLPSDCSSRDTARAAARSGPVPPSARRTEIHGPRLFRHAPFDFVLEQRQDRHEVVMRSFRCAHAILGRSSASIPTPATRESFHVLRKMKRSLSKVAVQVEVNVQLRLLPQSSKRLQADYVRANSPVCMLKTWISHEYSVEVTKRNRPNSKWYGRYWCDVPGKRGEEFWRQKATRRRNRRRRQRRNGSGFESPKPSPRDCSGRKTDEGISC